jgi:hypothetical protein
VCTLIVASFWLSGVCSSVVLSFVRGVPRPLIDGVAFWRSTAAAPSGCVEMQSAFGCDDFYGNWDDIELEHVVEVVDRLLMWPATETIIVNFQSFFLLSVFRQWQRHDTINGLTW